MVELRITASNAPDEEPLSSKDLCEQKSINSIKIRGEITIDYNETPKANIKPVGTSKALEFLPNAEKEA